MLVLAKVHGPQGRTVGVALRHCGSVRWGAGEQTEGTHTTKLPLILLLDRVTFVSLSSGGQEKMAREEQRNLSISRVHFAFLSRYRFYISQDLKSDTHNTRYARVTHARRYRRPMRFVPHSFLPPGKENNYPPYFTSDLFFD